MAWRALGWSCGCSQDTNAPAEPVRHPRASSGQCHHQLLPREAPTSPHFKKWGSVKGLGLYSFSNEPSSRHYRVQDRQTWSRCAREEARYQITELTGVVSGLQGLKPSPSRSTGHGDLTSDVVRRWEQLGKVPEKESTEAAPEGREDGGRVNQREQGGGRKKRSTVTGQGREEGMGTERQAPGRPGGLSVVGKGWISSQGHWGTPEGL